MDRPEQFREPPMAHQLAGLAKSRGQRAFMFSCEQGTGKTFIAINEAATLWGEDKINGALVFAPNGVHTNWTQLELPRWMPSWVRWRARAWNSDANKTEAAEFEEIMTGEGNDSTELRIATFNWEALAHDRPMDAVKRFIRSVTKLMIVGDESQAIADPTTKRVKALEKIKMGAVVRRTMTGTPILNAPFDAFAQYRFLDPTILRTTSYYAFKTEYADMMDPNHPMVRKITERQGGRVPQIVDKADDGSPRYKNLDKLARLIEPYTFRVLKKDCLDLPEKVYTQSFFELSGAQRVAYKKMDKEFRFLLADGEETAVSKLTALGKLSQISSGFLIDTATKTTLPIVSDPDNPKLKLLRERLAESIDELGNQVIVWARFREELHQIAALCKKAEWSSVMYYGDTSSADRTEAIRAFQAGERRVFIVQQKAGATGITLTAAAHVIYYSNTFSWGDRSQSEDRAHRIGQTKSVLYEDLIGRGTRDMRIVDTLRAKKDLAALINGDDPSAWA